MNLRCKYIIHQPIRHVADSIMLCFTITWLLSSFTFAQLSATVKPPAAPAWSENRLNQFMESRFREERYLLPNPFSDPSNLQEIPSPIVANVAEQLLRELEQKAASHEETQICAQKLQYLEYLMRVRPDSRYSNILLQIISDKDFPDWMNARYLAVLVLAELPEMEKVVQSYLVCEDDHLRAGAVSALAFRYAADKPDVLCELIKSVRERTGDLTNLMTGHAVAMAQSVVDIHKSYPWNKPLPIQAEFLIRYGSFSITSEGTLLWQDEPHTVFFLARLKELVRTNPELLRTQLKNMPRERVGDKQRAKAMLEEIERIVNPVGKKNDVLQPNK